MGNFKVRVAAAVAALVALIVGISMGIGAPAGAAASCDAADFTVDGVFDLQGYLACQSALAGGLPSTGSNNLQIAGIALGLLVIGIAFVVTSRRKSATPTA